MKFTTAFTLRRYFKENTWGEAMVYNTMCDLYRRDQDETDPWTLDSLLDESFQAHLSVFYKGFQEINPLDARAQSHWLFHSMGPQHIMSVARALFGVNDLTQNVPDWPVVSRMICGREEFVETLRNLGRENFIRGLFSEGVLARECKLSCTGGAFDKFLQSCYDTWSPRGAGIAYYVMTLLGHESEAAVFMNRCLSRV